VELARRRDWREDHPAVNHRLRINAAIGVFQRKFFGSAVVPVPTPECAAVIGRHRGYSFGGSPGCRFALAPQHTIAPQFRINNARNVFRDPDRVCNRGTQRRRIPQFTEPRGNNDRRREQDHISSPTPWHCIANKWRRPANHLTPHTERGRLARCHEMPRRASTPIEIRNPEKAK
jgi:hypothetical protein